MTLEDDDAILTKRILGCYMAYATAKAEIVADLVPKTIAQLFKTYRNLCPFKHCWMEKSMGATKKHQPPSSWRDWHRDRDHSQKEELWYASRPGGRRTRDPLLLKRPYQPPPEGRCPVDLETLIGPKMGDEE